MALLEVHDLRTYFHTRNGIVRAVDGVSFTIEKGETLGIVGESGSGKSVTCYSLLRLLPEPPGRIESGKALFKNEDLLQAVPERIAAIRGKNITMIFQDPMTSLNPYLRVEEQVIEPLVIHEGTARGPARARAIDMLKEVGIHDAASRLSAYPHEFSGGMRQRVMIAMSLITEPDLLIADEPTTALDVTVQAQILELIKRAQQRMGMAVILISHDLGVVAGAAERILVMYAGRIVECGATTDVFRAAQHPYTRALQKSIPALQKKGEPLYTIAGMPPDLSKPIKGCPFAPRCEFARELCVQNEVHLEDVAPGHATACLRVQRGELDLDETSLAGRR